MAGDFSSPPCPCPSPPGTPSSSGGTPQVSAPRGRSLNSGVFGSPCQLDLSNHPTTCVSPLGVFHSKGLVSPSTLSHSLGIAAEVFLPSDLPSPVSGVPPIVPPPYPVSTVETSKSPLPLAVSPLFRLSRHILVYSPAAPPVSPCGIDPRFCCEISAVSLAPGGILFCFSWCHAVLIPCLCALCSC